MSSPLPHPWSRRRFLAGGGALAGALLVGACGGSGDDEPVASGGVGDSQDPAGDLVLVPYVSGPLFGTGLRNRIPFGLADREGLLPASATPGEVEVAVLDPDGRPVGDAMAVGARTAGLERAYFPLLVEVDEPGIYTARADLGGPAAVEMAFEVKDAAELTVIKPGDVMPPMLTPTTADARGVDPICTADPVCSLHELTAADALATGRPVALLVATPAFCKVAACGPVHHVLLSVLPQHDAVEGLHLEVYAHPHENLVDFVPNLAELGLFLEPCLVLVGSDGIVAQRLDAIYDETELDAALGRLT